MEKKYWQMKGGEAKRDWDGWQSVSLSSLFWLMEYSCCILNIPHNLLPNIWPRVHIGTHSPYFLSVTNPLCVLTYFHIFLLFNTSLFFNLFHFSHLSSFSFVLLLSVMTHWMCPDCGVPSICIHGIFGGGGGFAAIIDQMLVLRASVQSKKKRSGDQTIILTLLRWQMMKTFTEDIKLMCLLIYSLFSCSL